MKLRRSLGFTLIELIIVIGILGSITAIAAPNVLGSKDTAEEEACRDQMDFLLQGFQNEQLYPDSEYAFTSVTEDDGVKKLNDYIDLAIDPATSNQVDFPDHVTCPSGDTQYEAYIGDDGLLYVHCPVHDVYSHTGLRGRAPKTDPTVYDTGDGWTGRDDNWIIGDHENFFVMPMESQYYHMEIGFQMIKYDDGDGLCTLGYDYDRDDPDWFWPIPTARIVTDGSAFYTVNETPSSGPGRAEYYTLDSYNGTNDGLTFAMVVDYQETADGLNFSANSLQIKNVNSNALDKMDLDVMKDSGFDPEETTPVVHQRDMFDDKLDWIIIDVVQQEEGSDYKTMYIHMQQADDSFVQLFCENVPVADPELGDVEFAFFVGKRAESKNNELLNGVYYPDAYPTPIQVYMDTCFIDFDGYHEASEKQYSYWYSEAIQYEDFENHLPDRDPPPPYSE